MFFTQEFIYLCNMKNFLFILTLLFGMLLFVPEDVQNNDTTLDLQVQKEAVMIEKGTADMQHNLEILSSDLKGCNCLTPRRSIQNVSNTLNIRLLKIEEKAIQYFRLKEINLLRKVSEEVTNVRPLTFQPSFAAWDIMCMACGKSLFDRK